MTSLPIQTKKKSVVWSADNRARLARIAQRRGYTHKELLKKIDDAGFFITPRMVGYHLRETKAYRYLSSQDKDNLCDQVLRAASGESDYPQIDTRTRDRLVRHVKQRSDDSASKRRLLSLLRNITVVERVASEDEIAAVDDGDSGVDDFSFLEQASSTDPGSSEPQEPQEPQNDLEWDTFQLEELEDIMRFDTGFETLLPGPHQSPVSLAPSQLCLLSQNLYEQKLRGAILPDDGYSSRLNSSYWTLIRSGIYYLKKNDDRLATINFTRAVPLASEVCRTQPLELLKEFFATLSYNNNTTTSLPVRKAIIWEFFSHAERLGNLGPGHTFTELCRILHQQDEGGTDGTCIAVLSAMRDSAIQHLDPTHPEQFQLSTALIRTYRRVKLFSKAKLHALELINTSTLPHEESKVRTRRAMTEYCHILIDDGDYEQAFAQAFEVYQRGLSDCPDGPDDRCIYAMEDLAFICEKQDQLDDAIKYLRMAQRAALKVWANHTSTEHIMDKLESLQDKRYHRACIAAGIAV